MAKIQPEKDTCVNLERKPCSRYLLSLLLLSLHFLYSDCLVRTNLPSSPYLLDICVFQSSNTEDAVQHTTATTTNPLSSSPPTDRVVYTISAASLLVSMRKEVAHGTMGLPPAYGKFKLQTSNIVLQGQLPHMSIN
jgi:hypothetical protein